MKFERGAFSVWWVISVMSGIPAAWSWMLRPSSSRSLLFQRRCQRPNILLRQQPKNMEDVDDENEPSATSFFSDDDCFDLCEVTDDEKDNEKDNRPLDVPTFGETTPQPVTATTSSQTTTVATSTTIPDEECYDLCDTEDLVVESPEETKQPNVAAAASETRKPGSGNARHRLMLQWEVTHSIEECDVDLDNLYQDNDLSTTAAAAAAAAEEEPCGAMACKTCQGEGVVSCRFCAGCGFLTVGNEQVMMGTGTTCPICQAGEEACPSCRGSGWIARWQPDMHIVSNNSSNGDTL